MTRSLICTGHITFQDWKKIEQAEEMAARDGAPREKFVDVEAMIRARGSVH